MPVHKMNLIRLTTLTAAEYTSIYANEIMKVQANTSYNLQ